MVDTLLELLSLAEYIHCGKLLRPNDQKILVIDDKNLKQKARGTTEQKSLKVMTPES